MQFVLEPEYRRTTAKVLPTRHCLIDLYHYNIGRAQVRQRRG